MTDRKRRSDAFDASLSESERAAVYAAMKVSWVEAQKLCADTFDLSVGKSALYEFARDYRESESERRIQDALAFQVQTRRAVDQIGDMDAEMAAGWEQLALEASLSDNVELAEQYLGLAEKLHSRALERAKLDLKILAEERSREDLELAKKQFQERIRTDLERGLQALYDQVASNPQAVELVRKLQGIVGKEGSDG